MTALCPAQVNWGLDINCITKSLSKVNIPWKPVFIDIFATTKVLKSFWKLIVAYSIYCLLNSEKTNLRIDNIYSIVISPHSYWEYGRQALMMNRVHRQFPWKVILLLVNNVEIRSMIIRKNACPLIYLVFIFIFALQLYWLLFAKEIWKTPHDFQFWNY